MWNILYDDCWLISTYVVKFYLNSSLLVLFPHFSMETNVPSLHPHKSCTSTALKSREDFILTSQMHDISPFQAALFLLGVKQWHGVWNFKAQAGLFVHLDATVFLQVHRWRCLHGHSHDKNPIVLDFGIISSFIIIIIIFLQGSKSISSYLLQQLVMEIWKPSCDHMPLHRFQQSHLRKVIPFLEYTESF